MNETHFRNAQVGDRVWDVRFGWGTIHNINYNNSSCIGVCFRKSVICNEWYTRDGCHNNCGEQVLFWDEVKIVPPPKPKRKVKKTVEAWAVIYCNGSKRLYEFESMAQREINQCLAVAPNSEVKLHKLTSEPFEVEE